MSATLAEVRQRTGIDYDVLRQMCAARTLYAERSFRWEIADSDVEHLVVVSDWLRFVKQRQPRITELAVALSTRRPPPDMETEYVPLKEVLDVEDPG